MNQIALPVNLATYLREYEEKNEQLENALAAYTQAGSDLQMACTISAEYGGENLDIRQPWLKTLQKNLLVSAWKRTYNYCDIAQKSSAKDKKLFEQSIANPAPFTKENIIASFGEYILNPRANILRGLAEVFCDLDPAYKSHDKVRIGKKGLPKRVIVTVSNYGWAYNRLKNILDAIALYQGKPLVHHIEMMALLDNEDALLKPWSDTDHKGELLNFPARGVWLKRFKNGNGHLYFDDITLVDINKALAEYYGDALADDSHELPEQKRQSTDVAKDLQYYPTPQEVIDKMLSDVWLKEGVNVLEPSCGCGRIMDAVRDTGANVYGIEYDAGRVAEAKAKGHSVLQANFLETIPKPDFDYIIMNPPFYGKHYAKHIEHAMKFLKEGGRLIAVLPVTARYDHGLVDGNWHDLPVGSFKESDTNINTTILTKWNK